MRHLKNFFLLFGSVLLTICGILIFRSLFKDFSLDYPTYKIIFTPVISTALISGGLYMGFYAFRAMKNS